MPVPYVTVSNKVMNLTGGLQSNKAEPHPRPRSMLLDYDGVESLRIKKGGGSIVDDHASIVSRLNSSMFGFDSKLQTLNVKMTMKK